MPGNAFDERERDFIRSKLFVSMKVEQRPPRVAPGQLTLLNKYLIMHGDMALMLRFSTDDNPFAQHFFITNQTETNSNLK